MKLQLFYPHKYTFEVTCEKSSGFSTPLSLERDHHSSNPTTYWLYNL